MKTTKKRYSEGLKEENILYVILNGLITLVDIGKKGYIAYLLEMGDEHRYLYGNWLLEDSIPMRRKGQNPMDATLAGVYPEKESNMASHLDPAFNAVLKLPGNFSPIDNNIRALFRLPRPQKIHHFVCGEVSRSSITLPPAAFVKSRPPDLLSAIRIFEYRIVMDERQIPTARLIAGDRSPLWRCPGLALVPKTTRNIAVLHIYDEPGYTMRRDSANDHNLREFNLSMGFLGKKKATLTASPEHVVHHPEYQPPILGLLLGETNSLDKRELNLMKLLTLARSGGDISDPVGTGGQVCSGGNGKVGG